jgi:hypothetical protein
MSDPPKSGGRQKGSRNLRTLIRRYSKKHGLIQPLDALLAIINDPQSSRSEVLDAAGKAAPYCHARLISQHISGGEGGLTHDDWIRQVLGDEEYNQQTRAEVSAPPDNGPGNGLLGWDGEDEGLDTESEPQGAGSEDKVEE